MSVSEPSDTEAAWQVPARLHLELLALLSADPTRPAMMTYDEFLAWADEDTLAEWVDGRVVMTTPTSAQHQYLAPNLPGTPPPPRSSTPAARCRDSGPPGVSEPRGA